MLSIIIPVYNGNAVISSCLEGILSSNYQDYEIIVVDDKSTDNTVAIAKKYTKNTHIMPENKGAGYARDYGCQIAKGDTLVFIDSDVIIRSDTLTIIAEYFANHPDVDAVTGLLAKEHPHRNFFSQYKNLYMHYIFSQLPQQVTFLYGSIHAVRSKSFTVSYCSSNRAQDTEIGQKLAEQGKVLHFIPELEVVHLKKYTFLSFIKNDFVIPFDWTKIFIECKGWKQLGKKSDGYAHSPKEQLLSIATIGIICLLLFLNMFFHMPVWFFIVLMVTWGVLNTKFLSFLRKEKGFFYFLFSVFITFIDNFIMGFAIFCGLLWNSIGTKQ